MYRFATAEDTERVIDLWNMAFPEEPDFNYLFFKFFYKPETCLLHCEEDKIISMAQMLPYEIRDYGKVTYIYGATTHPDYRGRGLMSALLRESFEIDKKNNVKASILIPQNKPLFDFYEKIGYKTRFFIKKCEAKAVNTEGYSLVPVYNEDIDLVNSLYESLQKSFILRTREYWQGQINMFTLLGGNSYLLYKGEKPVGYGFVSEDFVQELFAVGYEDIFCTLAKAKTYCTLKGKEPMGMAYCYEKPVENMYINLLFN